MLVIVVLGWVNLVGIIEFDYYWIVCGFLVFF